MINTKNTCLLLLTIFLSALFFTPLTTYGFNNSSHSSSNKLTFKRPDSPIPPPPVNLTDVTLSPSEPIILNTPNDTLKYNISRVGDCYYIRYLNITTDQPYAIFLNCGIVLEIEYCFFKSQDTDFYVNISSSQYIGISYCEFYGTNGIFLYYNDDVNIVGSAFYVSNTSIAYRGSIEVLESFFFKNTYFIFSFRGSNYLDFERNVIANVTNGLYISSHRPYGDTGAIKSNNFLFVKNYAIHLINTSFEISYNDFILCNNSTDGLSQAYDNGINNHFRYNFWLYWKNASKPYPIDGSANNTDPKPYPVPYSSLTYQYFFGYYPTITTPTFNPSASSFPFYSFLLFFFLILLKPTLTKIKNRSKTS